MQKEKVAIRNGKAFKTNKVDITIKYKNERYELNQHSNNDITPTGLLTVGELTPKDETLPGFLFRWDENAESLDVDITNTTNKIEREFKAGKKGYGGHHTKRIPDAKNRIFEVSIKLPRINVFEGEVSFGLHRELEATIPLKPSVNASVEKKECD